MSSLRVELPFVVGLPTSAQDWERKKNTKISSLSDRRSLIATTAFLQSFFSVSSFGEARGGESALSSATYLKFAKGSVGSFSASSVSLPPFTRRRDGDAALLVSYGR